MTNTRDSKTDTEIIGHKVEIALEPIKNGGPIFDNFDPVQKHTNVRQWLVILASFVCNGLIFGLINSVSVIYNELQRKLELEGVDDASTKASFVGSLGIGMTFFLSPVAGILTDSIGIRRTTFLGGLLAVTGLLASSFFVHSVEVLYLTFGIVLGVGASLAYTPSLVILGHYFKDNLAAVNGFVTAGSSVFTLVFPFILDTLIVNIGLAGCFQTLALLFTLLMGCALVFKPVASFDKSKPSKPRHNHTVCERMKEVINVENWKKRNYVVWAMALPIALLGYFVSYVHLVKFIDLKFPGYDGKILIQCIAITSLLGRLIFGKIADFPRVDKILLQQVSIALLGVLTMLLVVPNNYYLLIPITLGIGIFDGCFISLIGPVAFDICGHKGATQAIGFVLGLCSIPITLGPPMAGHLYEVYNSYTAAFVVSGVPPLIGAFLMFFMRCGNAPVVDIDPAEEPLRSNDCEMAPKQVAMLTDMNGDPRPLPPSYKEATTGGPIANGTVPHIDSSQKAVLTTENSKEERR